MSSPDYEFKTDTGLVVETNVNAGGTSGVDDTRDPGRGPTAFEVLREAIKAANRRPWRTLAVAAVALAMCLSVFFTYGQTEGTQRRVMAELESPAARLISISWRLPAGGIDPTATARIASLSQVEWVVGMSPAADIRNAAIMGGTSCPAKVVIGQLPGVIPPQPFDDSQYALVTVNSSKCLGLVYPVGTASPVSAQQVIIHSDAVPIIGRLDLPEALSNFQNFTFIWQSGETPVAEIFVLAQRAQDIPNITEAALALVGANNSSDIAVDSSAERLALYSLLEQELATNSRVIALSVLGAGMAFIGLTLTLSVGSQRRDFGRRRALGASRSMLIVLVILEATIPAFLGSVIGTAAGGAALLLLHGIAPGLPFILSVPILSVLAAVVGSIPAALTAAFRDPVATLRVP